MAGLEPMENGHPNHSEVAVFLFRRWEAQVASAEDEVWALEEAYWERVTNRDRRGPEDEMRSFYRLMLGRKSVHAVECFAGNFIGVDFGVDQDLTGKLPEEWREFNKAFIPIFLAGRPEKTKVAAGLACGAIWTVSKGIGADDIVLCPDGAGAYEVGQVSGDYYYQPGEILPHRRPVQWRGTNVDRQDMSEALRNSTGSIGTISNVTKYSEEIEQLISGVTAPTFSPRRS